MPYLKKNPTTPNLNSLALSSATDVSVAHLKACVLFLDFTHWQRPQRTPASMLEKEVIIKRNYNKVFHFICKQCEEGKYYSDSVRSTRSRRTKYFGCFPKLLMKTKIQRGLLPVTITQLTSMEVRPAVYIRLEINCSSLILFSLDEFQPLLLAEMHRSWFCELLCSHRLLQQPGALHIRLGPCTLNSQNC